MSYNERSDTSYPASSADVEYVDGDSQTDVSFEQYPEAQDKDIDDDFIQNHLRDPPDYVTKVAFDRNVATIIGVKNIEGDAYAPAATLLNLMSEAIFDSLSVEEKRAVRTRYRIPDDKPGHLTFLVHSSVSPSHFPEALTQNEEKPDLVGLFNADNFKRDDGTYGPVPWHRVETMVEAKSAVKNNARPQAAAYAHRHHQARPDRPMVYCLIIKPQWYQVILSSSAGVVASPERSWAVRDLLGAYIYAHYNPPAQHFLVDESINWVSAPRALDPPSWTITFEGKTYTDGKLIFIGPPWGKRTAVLQARNEKGDWVILKETYHNSRRRWSEDQILDQIHADGDVPGVVRMGDAAKVMSQGEIIQCRNDKDKTLKVKHRLEFFDIGQDPLTARSVNDLLKAFYDVLEAHRTMLMKRKVLHRDMSRFNIRIYPKWAKLEGRTVLESAPPLIADILNGVRRPLNDLTAEGLVIDVEHAALLAESCGANVEDLMHRTGTPIYIARSVCLGGILTKSYVLNGVRMPNLEGEALRLYVQVHGQEQYNKYNEKTDQTSHGGTPPTGKPDRNLWPTFTHRPEHDVESIFWSMFTTSLRVRPISSTPEKSAPKSVTRIWKTLRQHAIVEDPLEREDQRSGVFDSLIEEWESLYLPEMHDFARLMWDISNQIAPEYALWSGQLLPDHLHEAVQRLILQYLVNHRDKDIALDPKRLRPTGVRNERLIPFSIPEATEETEQLGETPDDTGRVVTRARGTRGNGRAAKKTAQRAQPRGARTRDIVRDTNAEAGPSNLSKGKAKTYPNFTVVVEGSATKRSTARQGGRKTKRRKDADGEAFADDSEDEDEDY